MYVREGYTGGLDAYILESQVWLATRENRGSESARAIQGVILTELGREEEEDSSFFSDQCAPIQDMSVVVLYFEMDTMSVLLDS